MARGKAPVPLPFGIADAVLVEAIREVPMDAVIVPSVTTGIEYTCLVTWAHDGNGERVALVLAVLYTDETGHRLGIGQQLREARLIAP